MNVESFNSLEKALIKEKIDIHSKCERLERFIAVHVDDLLDSAPANKVMRDLMMEQLMTMRKYEALLSMRIELHHLNGREFHPDVHV